MNNMLYRPSAASNTPATQHFAGEDGRMALLNALGGGVADNAAQSSLLQSLQVQQASGILPGAPMINQMDFNQSKRKADIDDSPGPKRSRKTKKKTSAAAINAASSVLVDKIAQSQNQKEKTVPAATVGLDYFNDNDVLSGRGGGTNVHPGNRHFRDLINLHRRAYLKARKNDKPAISRAIVKAIRDANGRFLKKDEDSGLWFEIGDDAAREKTSQALRQRAPEMRRILYESEREQARQEAEGQLRVLQHQLHEIPLLQQQMMALNQQKLAAASGMAGAHQDPITQNLMTAAILGGRINQFAPNGA